MSAIECYNCGRDHDIEDSTSDFVAAGNAYIMYTCPENGTTYGRTIADGNLDG